MDIKQIDKKWQKFWDKKKINFCNLNDYTKPKFYNLVMFYYPSGANIHVGHAYNYIGSDVYGRFKKMRGYNVFQPMGSDAFGLPAENFAIKTGVHPSITTKKNIEIAKKQLKKMGIMYDWQKEIDTSSPDYYKWTQWLFSVLYKRGLAYRAKAPVNWCSDCHTVLANEQVNNGCCERCDTKVVQKKLNQWFFKITDYAERLLDYKDLDWPKKTILMQKNWIGKSQGVEIDFLVKATSNKQQNQNKDFRIKVFTTRADTLFGCTFIVVALEHSLIKQFSQLIENLAEVKKYIKRLEHKSDLDRTDLNKDKTGIEIKGIKGINPINGAEIPIFVADYVLMSYGTGAVMGVPAHDERDFEFAKKHNLKIIEVIKDPYLKISSKLKQAFVNYGILINSEQFTGLSSKQAIKEITQWLEKKGLARNKIQYKLRDWLISRQRYWGAPIPIIYCDNCGIVLDEILPIKLPDLKDFKPIQDGISPLDRVKEFINIKCPKCKGKAKRATETMDTFVCSSWYFLRFINPNLKTKAFEKQDVEHWLPVDQYCGGAEQACLHLLYSRFITKVLFDAGYIDFDEPFKRLTHQGMILTAEGSKMSKSKGTVVVPDNYIQQYGADIFRIYILFLAPFEEGGVWDDRNILGIKRFLEKAINLFQSKKIQQGFDSSLETIIHQTIKKNTEDIKNFKFNTAISNLMILLNQMQKQKQLFSNDVLVFIQLLAPFAPHLAEELYRFYKNLFCFAKKDLVAGVPSRLNDFRYASARNKDNFLDKKDSIFYTTWPEYNEEKIKQKNIRLILEVNNKVRDVIEIDKGITQKQVEEIVLQNQKIKKNIGNQKIKRIVFVPNKLINIITE